MLKAVLVAGLFLLIFTSLVVMLEKKIVFYPVKYPEGEWHPEAYGWPAEDVWFDSSDGVRLHGWYFPAGESARGTLLWFHGNAGNITHRLENILLLRPLRINVFIFDYRGYGQSRGEPEEAGLYRDARSAYDWLTRVKGEQAERLILFGRSLGAAFAVAVAAEHPSAGVILETAFPSARDMARVLYPFLPVRYFMRSRFDSLERIGRVRVPKLFVHGTADGIVPYEMGRKLFDAAPEPREFYDIPGAGHNDTYLVGGTAYFARLDRFISRVLGEAATGAAGGKIPGEGR